MSRVQVENLVVDFEDEFIIGGSGAFLPEKLYSRRLTEISDIEIVPRKIVELIIEKCIEIQHDNNDDYDRHELGKWCASDDIKEYAESLLKLFEEDE